MLKKVVIAGASGLVGGYLLKILLEDTHYEEILAIGRKELPVTHPKLVQLIIDYNNIEKVASSINGHALFCCLGTTKKKTPDTAEYQKIDLRYPEKLAQIAAQNGIEQFHFVSALGANRKSSNFYLHTKGEAEKAISRSGIKNIQIYQPSLLTGDRSEFRLGEKIAILFMNIIDPLLVGKLKKYKSIPAFKVALSMFNQSLKNEEGVFIHPSDKIKLL